MFLNLFKNNKRYQLKKKANLVRRVAQFHILQISLLSGLITANWKLVSFTQSAEMCGFGGRIRRKSGLTQRGPCRASKKVVRTPMSLAHTLRTDALVCPRLMKQVYA